MTPYTQTLIGHLTSVKAGAMTARLVEPGEGKRPRISSRVDVDMTGQPGSFVAITQGEIKILASITSIK
ncbi:MAG: hypothetical protein KJO10_06690, partial [Gammaproteobacteria bacterium]|nr:hypothetical protein [Gammaproteobacteria bacterium]